MKKIYSTSSYKLTNTKRADRSVRRRKSYKKFKTRLNKSKLFKGRQRKIKRKKNVFSGLRTINAPQKLSLLSYPVETIAFITELKSCLNNRIRIKVNLTNVVEVKEDALVVLLSILVKFKTRYITFGIKHPKNADVNSLLLRSNFYKSLSKNRFDDDRWNGYKLPPSMDFHTHGMSHVEAKLTEKLLADASKTVWGEERRCQGVQRAFIELMLNTNNHAYPNTIGEKNWWICVNHSKSDNKVCFSFVDYGVGIFQSLNNKKEGTLFYGAINKLKALFGAKTNSEILRLILIGELHKTVTGKYYRGKGLPGICRAYERNSFSRLHIISNNVYANLDSSEYKEINANFAGTFVYWEISQQNTSSHD